MNLTAELLARSLVHQLTRPGDDLLSKGARDAAVVLPIELGAEPTVLAVLRGSNVSEHASEVGFPGGKPDPGDADLWGTAVRELEEEIGIGAADVERIGLLTPCPVITGRYLIHPFVGVLRSGVPSRIVSAGEIARILSIPILPWIRGESPILGVRAPWRGETVVAPHFELEGCILYGASAYIFYELLVRIAGALGREVPPMQMVEKSPWGGRYTPPEA
jgi:8-oxo-dGTP pyrophosphatase MutT (NUDIX family)